MSKLIVASLAAVAVLLLPAAPDAQAQDAFSGTVSYWKLTCPLDLLPPSKTRVAFGRLLLQRGAETASVPVDKHGAFSGTIKGSGPIAARLQLDSDLLFMRTKGTTTPLEPLEVALQVVQKKKGKVVVAPSFPPGAKVELLPDAKKDHDHAALNAWTTLQNGAEVASIAYGKELPKVTVVWDHNPSVAARDLTQYDSTKVRINVGRTESGQSADYEALPLLQAYGHHVLHSIAAPGGSPPPGGHKRDQAYPKNPEIAWGEGFPSAFAAVVLNKPELALACGFELWQKLGSTPAQVGVGGAWKPLTIAQRRYAQYNETTGAAVGYALMGKLGAGNRSVGLGKLLMALEKYKRGGKPASTMRDIRDLVITAGFEHTKAQHVAYDNLFGRQDMVWRRFMFAKIQQGALIGFKNAWLELALTVNGPSGWTCKTTSDIVPLTTTPIDHGLVFGIKVKEGGLDYSANDDCYLDGPDGVVPNPPGAIPGHLSAQFTIPFPYLESAGHWAGDYTVVAHPACAVPPGTQGTCGPNVPVESGVPLVAHFHTPVAFTKTIPVGSDTPLVTFSAIGDCTAGGKDCGF